MNKPLLLLALSAGLLLQALGAAAGTMGFESLRHDDDLVVDAGHLFVEDGYRVENSGILPFATYGTLDTEFSGSTALINDNADGLTTLTKANGRVFNLISIDLTELIVGDGVDYDVEFTGTTFHRGTVTLAFSLNGLRDTETLYFDARFSDLIAVSWANTGGGHQFDNIVAVPEPATLGLSLCALGILGGMVRNRRGAGR